MHKAQVLPIKSKSIIYTYSSSVLQYKQHYNKYTLTCYLDAKYCKTNIFAGKILKFFH